MAELLLVHHTVSPATQELLEAALAGTKAEGLEDVTVTVRPALGATASDVLAADGFLLGTPANIGYLSGAMKHFFDTVYYPCLSARAGAPYGLYVHGNQGADGAVRAAETITAAMGWTRVHEPVVVSEALDKADREAVWELAATVCAALL